MSRINKDLKEGLFRAYNTRNRNQKQQRSFDLIFGTVFTACMFLFMAAVVVMGSVNVRAGAIMLLAVLGCLGTAVTYALFRKRRIMKRLFPVRVGAENIEKKYVENTEILECLYAESALTIGMEAVPDAEFFNILYNWLNGMNALRDGKMKLYLLTGKQWNQSFDVKVSDGAQIICISMRDLNLNKENEEQFSYEYFAFGRYMDDIAIYRPG